MPGIRLAGRGLGRVAGRVGGAGARRAVGVAAAPGGHARCVAQVRAARVDAGAGARLPSNITREYPHSLLILQGNTLIPFYILQILVSRFVGVNDNTHRARVFVRAYTVHT